MPKNASSHCVINMLVPRESWGEMQRHRTATTPEQRCGPHISFVDPFVEIEHYKDAAAILTRALSKFKPFTVTLRTISHFAFKSSATAYLAPETDPPNAIDELSEVLLALFPQCNDQIRKSPTGRLVPHFSLAKFANERECLSFIAATQSSWQPVVFTVNHLFLLHRVGGDPFRVVHAVPIGSSSSSVVPHPPPCFGSTPPIDETGPVSRTLLVGGLPKQGIDREKLTTFFTECGLGPFTFTVEILANPPGTPRGLATLQFPSMAFAHRAAATWRLPAHSITNFLSGSPYLAHLHCMTYPDHQGGTCTLVSSRQHFQFSFEFAGTDSTLAIQAPEPLPQMDDYSALLAAKGPIVQSAKLLSWTKNSALILEIERPEIRSEVDTIRRRYDKGAERWMPHITLLHPFIAETEPQYHSVIDALRSRLAELPSFPMHLRQLGSFKQSSNSQQIFLNAESPVLEQLRAALLSYFPGHPSRSKHNPHLTLGQWPIKPIDEISESIRMPLLQTSNIWVAALTIVHATDRGAFFPSLRIPLLLL